nr:gamma-glutamyl-gamma-aminobutyrate hydrolase family protein [Oscillochloris trichoides]
MSRPLIGISCMQSQDERGSTLMGVRPAYLKALEAAGSVPVPIPLSDDLEIVRSLYRLCDGILLPGGDDVDPAHYHEEPHPDLGAVDPQRDVVEIALARWSREDRKPLMGICRGIQVINVAFGGSLYQDLGAQYANAFDHRLNIKLHQYDILTHSISLNPESWLARHLGVEEVMGNTMHHQAVKDVAPGLRVVGHAHDGVIEAVEGTGEQFVVAVQCHPEHLWANAEPRWQQVFAGFVAACRR